MLVPAHLLLAVALVYVGRTTDEGGGDGLGVGYRGKQRVGPAWAPLRVDWRPTETFLAFARRVSSAVEQLESRAPALESSEPSRSSGTYPFAFVIADDDPTVQERAGFVLTIRTDGRSMTWSGSSDVLPDDVLHRLDDAISAVVHGVVDDPAAPLYRLPLMGASEKHRVLVEWNATAHRLGNVTSVHAMFEAQVDRTPDAVAVIFQDARLTYRELDRRANGVARWLLAQGVRLEDRVAVEVERSADMLAGVLGVMKAGAAYVPIDVTLPEDRKQFMKDDASVAVVLDGATLAAALATSTSASDASRPAVGVGPEHLAYVLYTSGSTGRPKGVMVEHASVANLLASLAHEPGIDAGETTLSVTTLSFDVSVAELFFPLVNGAKVVIGSREAARDPQKIADLIEATGARTFGATPATWRMMVDSGWRPTRGMEIHCAGEALPPDLASALLENGATLWNLYGPTEATVYATGIEVQRGEPITIGRPLRNTQLYIVDEHMQPVPIGVAGELCIAGDGVARGYLGRPALTAEKFAVCPFGTVAGARMYRTGDLARWLPTGEVDYLGRLDFQVKIRGYRIELGEIEALLLAQSSVRAAVVLAREDVPGDKRLVAYVLARASSTIDVEALRSELGRALPDYMVPSAFVVLDALPLNSNGKIDRKALPAPDLSAALAAQYVAPRDALEGAIASIFEQVLRVPRVGVHDDFLALGGHSLLATQVVSRVRAALSIELSVRMLFEAPTVAQLAERGRRASGSGTGAPAIEKVDRTKPVRASFAQTRLWFLDQLEGSSATYNVPIVTRLDGALDVAVLERAVQALVDRHETLRTTFVAIDGEPYQQIQPSVSVALTRVQAASEQEVRAAIAREVNAAFDLARGPLLRATLIGSPAASSHVLVLCVHHVATDGWSSGVLLSELSSVYTAFADGAPSPLPPLHVEYADFAVWQRAWISGDVLDEQLAFWKEHLAGAPAALELPLDRPRPATKQHKGDRVAFELPPSAAALLRGMCRREGVTPFMVLLAAYQIVLSRWSGQRDVVVGTAIANRVRAEIEPIVGFFVNTLALRTTFAQEDSFASVVERVKQLALSAYSHQDVPFERLVDEVGVARDMSRTPLFQAYFVLQNAAQGSLELGDVVATTEDFDFDIAKFDLALVLEEQGDTFRGTLEYDVALFDRATIERFVEHFGVLVEGALGSPDQRVALLPLMTEAEQHRVLVEWNDTARELPRLPHIVALFEEQARRRPDHVAVVFGARTMTYRELDEESSRLAGRLRGLGVRPRAMVGITTTRSLELIVGLLAILKAGAAYVPLEPSLPEERVALIAADVGMAFALDPSSEITLPGGVRRLAPGPNDVVTTNHDGDAVTLLPRDAAYVLFTSGSTGKPKGVCIEHLSVVRLVCGSDLATYSDDDVCLMFAPLAFDASTWEIWVPLLNGGTVVVAPAGPLGVSELGELIARERVNLLFLTTALFHQVVDDAVTSLASVRHLVSGGDVLSVPHVERLRAALPHIRMVNGYGPTENTVFTTCHPMGTVAPGKSAPIGRPIANTTAYVLDSFGRPVPIGVTGELYTGGLGVGRGYVSRAELTAEKFVPDGFSGEPGARLYRTGDLARWLADGTIEFLGRIDNQVKIRGFRIELGEIEATLGEVADIREAVVLAREDVPGDKRLVAYVVWRSGSALEETQAFLRRRLPAYMVPNAFVVLDALPLNANGKVDRKALPAPDLSAALAAHYVAPRDALEAAMAGVFEQVLRASRVGVHDDFFALGGHSLLATQVVSRIRAALDLELSVRTLFEAPTVAQLADRGRKASAARDVAPPIQRVDRTKPVRASFAQTRLWFLDQLEGASATYNVPIVTRLEGALDVVVLERAVQGLVARHETLRTTFVAIDGEPYQVVQASAAIVLGRVQAAAEEDALVAITREVNAPFDLARGPVLRATLITGPAPSVYVLVLCIHHIATDGWSSGVILKELSSLYSAFAHGDVSQLAAPRIDYADFAVWQRAWLSGDMLDEQLAFWKEHLAGAPAALELPLDRPRPATKQHKGGRVSFELSATAVELVRATCRSEGATPFMVLLAAYQVVLSRWSGQRDVVVGTAIANRVREEIEPIVGFFVNTLALRTAFEDDDSFASVVARVKQTALSAYSHQDVPFEKLVDELRVPRDMSRTPLFQAFFVLQNAEGASLALGDVRATNESYDFDVAKFDLSLALAEHGDTFGGSIDYDVALFDRSTVERFAEHFGVLLEAALRAPKERVALLPLMTDTEQHRVVVEWNDTGRAVDDRRCVHEMFEEQARRTPDAVALELGSVRLTYRELDERANRLAHVLLERGYGPSRVIALCMERCVEMVVSLYAILKTGGAYAPLDPEHPTERLALLVRDLETPVVLVTAATASIVAGVDAPLLRVDTDVPASAPSTKPAIDGQGDLPAYVIYTSGSTGLPKGVLNVHSGLRNRLLWMQAEYGLTAEDAVLQKTPYTFDVSVWEFFWPLMFGARLVLAVPGGHKDPAYLAETIRQRRITTLHFVPSMLAVFVEHVDPATCGSLRRVICSGEALPRALQDRFLERFGAELHNLYGPTEASIDVSYWHCQASDPYADVPIGRPIWNTGLYVVEPTGAPCPIGVPGELCIGGAGVARGYWKRPELTAEKFVADRFARTPGARMYRTGDLARWRADGTLEYLGRIDHQIKLRGYRIELGEIESVLRANESVRSAVVVVREDIPGDKRLVAYVVGQDGGVDIDALKRGLGAKLPDYMVPSAFVVLDQMPLTTSGKADRKALPAPALAASLATAYIAPRTPTELAIAQIWAEVLHVDQVGAGDDFFALGGHSLRATQVVSRVRAALGADATVALLFEAPSLGAFAARVDAAGRVATAPKIGVAAPSPSARRVDTDGSPGEGGDEELEIGEI